MISEIQAKKHKSLYDSVESSSIGNAGANYSRADLDKTFNKPCFLDQLRIERYRAQRSGTPLSIVLLTQDKYSPTNLNEPLKMLRTIIRETDTAGYIDQNSVGVLMPYTDQAGAKKTIDKIAGSFINPQFSIATATFPDQVFDNLEKNDRVSSEVLELMLEDSTKHQQFRLHVKRAFDIVASVLALLVLSPLMLIAAILVKASSPGPVIFRQDRLGAKGVPFTFYKFRSMRTDTCDQIHRDFVLKLIEGNHSTINNGDEEKPLYKIKSDPRVTAVGKFIRKTSIDELPQLFNVLKGDMSLVGPRPPLAYEAEKYQAWHLRRILEMKPGITGLWQVDGRSRTGFDDAVRLDIRYLQKWSLLLDIRILFKTVIEVLRCRGAV
jgi:exopolysaccharide biosynthesis polyprenyl glycosylphosphotransferase